MKIAALLQQNAPVFSLEFFPPKTPKGEAGLFATLQELKPLNPGYVSVTYGAGGSSRSHTAHWVQRIQSEVGFTGMAHLSCAGNSQADLRFILQEFAQCGIHNIMAIRGDPPQGSHRFEPGPDGFRYASELIAFIRQEFGETFSLGGGGYPEGHLEAPSLEADLRHLKHKTDAGLDFIVTQLFFNNALYFGFVERARRAGITVPIVPGLMPITNLGQIRRFMDLCGASIPGPLLSRLEQAQTPEELLEIGIDHTTRQAAELLAAGVPGIHFYTLNKSPATRRVMEQLNLVRR